MRLFDLIKRKKPVASPSVPDATQGDYGGSYGYGHPAHKPDPGATYAFKPDQTRVLSVRKDQRWR